MRRFMRYTRPKSSPVEIALGRSGDAASSNCATTGPATKPTADASSNASTVADAHATASPADPAPGLAIVSGHPRSPRGNASLTETKGGGLTSHQADVNDATTRNSHRRVSAQFPRFPARQFMQRTIRFP